VTWIIELAYLREYFLYGYPVDADVISYYVISDAN